MELRTSPSNARFGQMPSQAIDAFQSMGIHCRCTCVCVCTRYGGDSMVVCNDWHSALVPMFIHAEKSTNPSIASAA